MDFLFFDAGRAPYPYTLRAPHQPTANANSTFSFAAKDCQHTPTSHAPKNQRSAQSVFSSPPRAFKPSWHPPPWSPREVAPSTSKTAFPRLFSNSLDTFSILGGALVFQRRGFSAVRLFGFCLQILAPQV